MRGGVPSASANMFALFLCWSFGRPLPPDAGAVVDLRLHRVAAVELEVAVAGVNPIGGAARWSWKPLT